MAGAAGTAPTASSSAPFVVLSERVLGSSLALFPTAACPTRDLVALAAGGSVSLARSTGKADIVWEYSARSKPSNPLKGKALQGPLGDVTALAWDPQGNYLAVGISTSDPDPPASAFALLSVQSGLPALPPISVPSAGTITTLAWHNISHTPDPNLSSFAASLIAKLPTPPPTVNDANRPSLPGGAGAMGAGGPASGVFGSAKNAMLQKEREKEAGRPLDMSVAAKAFPTLVPGLDNDRDDASANKPRQLTVLLAGDNKGEVHIYLDGSVFLGSVQVKDGSSVIGTVIRPDATCTMIAVVGSTPLAPPLAKLSLSYIQLSLPPTLVHIAEQSTMLRQSLAHAFEALQEARTLWDESRRIGKSWLARLADLSRAQATVETPVTQLLLLLVNGRSTVTLHDFLASKMNERVFSKWESTTASALEKLRIAAFMNVVPATEHIVLLLDELQAWSLWPEKFSAFALSPTLISSLLATSQSLLLSTSLLESLVLEEERCFSAFSHWVRFELEKVALQDGSDVRPLARFQPIPVAHYIRNCLGGDGTNGVGGRLGFGLGTVGLEQNAELREAEKWFEEMGREDEEVGAGKGKGKDGLEGMMKRMKEELKGQADALIVEAMGVERRGEGERERPPRVEETVVGRKAPTSLPVLLHLLASRLSKGMDEAVRRVGEGAVVAGSCGLGEIPAEAALVRGRMIDEEHDFVEPHCIAWVTDSSFNVCQRTVASFKFTSTTLKTAEGVAFEIVDFDFYDDVELVFVLKFSSDDGVQFTLATVPLVNFTWIGGPEPPTEPLLIARQHTLNPHFPPQSIALNGREGRRVACILGGEGRRLQVLEVEPLEEEAEGEGEGGEDLSMELEG